MPELYAIQKGVPVPDSYKQTGLVDALRKMEYMDSILIPLDKISSAHPSAKAAGVKIKTQRNDDGTVRIWRISPISTSPDPTWVPINKLPKDMSASELAMGGGFDPRLHPDLTPEGELPSGHYEQPDPYGPTIFFPDLDDRGRPTMKDTELGCGTGTGTGTRNSAVTDPVDIFS